MQAECSAASNASDFMNTTDDPNFQPQQPTRSLTINQRAFAQVAEILENASRNDSNSQQPVTININHVEKLEIFNGSLLQPQSSSPNGTASGVNTIHKSEQEQNVFRSFPQRIPTTRTAMERRSGFWAWIPKIPNPKPKPFTVTCNVRNVDGELQALELLLDTGSDAGNIIPYSGVDALGLSERIKPSAMAHINGIGEGTIKIDGTVEIVGKWDGSQEHSATFYVVDKEDKFVNETILGAESISTLKLLRMRMTKAQSHGINRKTIDTPMARQNRDNRRKDKLQNEIEIEEAEAKKKEAAKVAPTKNEDASKAGDAAKAGDASKAGDVSKAGDDSKHGDIHKARRNSQGKKSPRS